MSDATQIALIVTAGPTLVSLVTLIAQLKTHKAVEDVKKNTDGLTDKLVQATAVSSEAKGVLKEVDRARAETASNEAAVAKSQQ